jgi:hypothetical protein
MATTVYEQVKRAYESGAVTRKEIVALTDLNPDVVDLCVDLLIDSKEINPTVLKSGCATGGCTGCSLDDSCAPRPDFALTIGKAPHL